VDPTRELRERDALLDSIRPYVDEHGITNLTLESVAESTGIPLKQLGEFFETKDELIVALLARSRIKLRTRVVEALRDQALSPLDVRRTMWNFYVEMANESRLFFEAFGLALQDERYADFLHGVNDWLQLFADAAMRRGVEKPRAESVATLTLAVFRGAMLDYCATGDRARLDAAMELWFAAADWLTA
jgi:AcrR family transcriptional regulator